MFTVGEFSRLAQVSKRMLRYYDEIGLLRPIHTDKLTGYRYYSAEQLPDLNRILALKDLGLTLEQVQRILRDNVSTDEIQGMLLLKKVRQQKKTVIGVFPIDSVYLVVWLNETNQMNQPDRTSAARAHHRRSDAPA